MRLDPPLSVVLQHEVDHLDGKLYLDRISRLSSSRIKKSITKRRKSLHSLKSEMLSETEEKKIGRLARRSRLSKREKLKRKHNRRRNRN